MKNRLWLQFFTPHKDTTALTSYGFVPLLLQCRTPYAAVHTLVLLMMGIMMPETCWDKCLIINIRLVASCWFLSLHPTADLSNLHHACTNSINADICQTSVLETLCKSIHAGAAKSLCASLLRSWWNTIKRHFSFHFPLPFFQQGCLNIWGLTAVSCASSPEDKKKVTEIIWNPNLMQKCYFLSVFLARHISGIYAHHQEH